jgi:hypothetical protein
MEITERPRSIHETKDTIIYTTTVEGYSVFVKKAKTDEGMVANTREFNNQKFLTTVVEGKDVGFEFLEPTFDGISISYPDINEIADWLAVDSAPEIKMAPLLEYSEEMVRFFKFCLQIPYLNRKSLPLVSNISTP